VPEVLRAEAEKGHDCLTLLPILVTRRVSIGLMLSDRRHAQERWTADRRRRREVADSFGYFLADLAEWDWFMNPISFRDDGPDGPPVPDAALSRIREYFGLVQRGASKPIGWVVAEEFGRLGGRYHCHALVTGVSDLWRKFWWAEAFRRFGRTLIDPFDRERAAAFYAAKYEAKQLGGLHFGGTLAGKRLSDFEIPIPSGGKHVIVASDQLPGDYFRLGLGRWHR